MKKETALLITAMMTFAMMPWQNTEMTVVQAEETSAEEILDQSSQSRHRLIVYFSRWGNTDYHQNVDASTSASIILEEEQRYGTTEYMARMIQQYTGGDLHLIQTQHAYPEDFDTLREYNHSEMDTEIFPILEESDLDITQYDIVFIGYPIWAMKVPQPIFSFLNEYDLTGKTIIPFCTHDGYGAGSTYEEIAAAIPEATILEGLALESGEVPDASDTVEQWLREIGISQNTEDEKNEIPITITAGEQELEGILYQTALSDEIMEYFPLTVSMIGFGGREFYGGIEFIPENISSGQLNFENGDITYCPQNNTVAIFYAQTDRPNLTMEVIPIGKVTFELDIFEQLPGNVDITFRLGEEN